jgi:hypothetical protein
MSFRLMDSGWDKELDDALVTDRSVVRVICPFIKEKAAMRLLEHGRPEILEIITRYNLDCFCEGVSDISALRLLLQSGAKIRGIKNLHAKAYLIGAKRAIVTSANLTEQGLLRNHEFGFSSDDEAIAESCRTYFDRLWKHGRINLTLSRLDTWDCKVTTAWTSGVGTRKSRRLGDEGEDAGIPTASEVPPKPATLAEQGFVKFFGEGNNRVNSSLPVIEEVEAAGCHWACSYPSTKIPRQVKDGAVMFLGRLVDQPKDTLIFGRAIGLQYLEGRDDATEADMALRDWKATWPRYIRVHSAEFINGTLSDGVSLNQMMDELGSDSFAPTQRHAAAKHGNTDPRASLMQKAAIELTPQAIDWLNGRLSQCFDASGRISEAVLDKLDWPKIKL